MCEFKFFLLNSNSQSMYQAKLHHYGFTYQITTVYLDNYKSCN